MNILVGQFPQGTLHPAAQRIDDGLRPILITSAALALLSFVLHLLIMREFERLGIFFLNDVLFNTDTHDGLALISHGKRSHLRLAEEFPNSIHPYVWFYFSPFIRVLSKLAAGLHLTKMSEGDVRLALGALVVPTVAAAQTFCFGLLLFFLGFALRAMLLVSLIGVVSFSNLIFGSIPDHFMFSNLAATLVLLLTAVVARNPKLDRLWAWIAIGLFTTGITISNVAFVGIARFYVQVLTGARNCWKALGRNLLFAFLLFAFVLTTASVLGLAMDRTFATDPKLGNFVFRYLRDEPPEEALGRAAKGIASAVAPAVSDFRTGPPPRAPQTAYDVLQPAFGTVSIYPRFLLPTFCAFSAQDILGLLAFAGILAGGTAMTLKGGAMRVAAMTAASIVLFNLLLHSVWGENFFLYSQHWITASLLLFAGLFCLAERFRRIVTPAVTAYAIAVAWNNAIIVADLLSELRAAGSEIFG